MAVTLAKDHWKPHVGLTHRAYGPKSCSLYAAGPKRTAPGRCGMKWSRRRTGWPRRGRGGWRRRSRGRRTMPLRPCGTMGAHDQPSHSDVPSSRYRSACPSRRTGAGGLRRTRFRRRASGRVPRSSPRVLDGRIPLDYDKGVLPMSDDRLRESEPLSNDGGCVDEQERDARRPYEREPTEANAFRVENALQHRDLTCDSDSHCRGPTCRRAPTTTSCACALRS